MSWMGQSVNVGDGGSPLSADCKYRPGGNSRSSEVPARRKFPSVGVRWRRQEACWAGRMRECWRPTGSGPRSCIPGAGVSSRSCQVRWTRSLASELHAMDDLRRLRSLAVVALDRSPRRIRSNLTTQGPGLGSDTNARLGVEASHFLGNRVPDGTGIVSAADLAARGCRGAPRRVGEQHGKESASDAARSRALGRIVALFAALVVSLTLAAAARADVSFTRAYGWGVSDGVSQLRPAPAPARTGLWRRRRAARQPLRRRHR